MGKNNTHIYGKILVIVINNTANWHPNWLPLLVLSEFENNKADWNKLCGYFKYFKSLFNKKS